MERIVLISTDTLDVPGRRLKQQLKGLDAAVMAGVRHVTYTSLTHPDPDSPVELAKDHWGIEQALNGSNISSTVLRNNLYTDFLIAKLNHAIKDGKLMAASGSGLTGYVTREDCAQAAAASVSTHDGGHKTLDITGPALVSQAELAKLASQISGKEIPYLPVPAAGMKGGLEAAGLPLFVVDMLVTFDQSCELGQLAVVSGAVKDLSGKAPQGVAEFLAENKAALLA